MSKCAKKNYLCGMNSQSLADLETLLQLAPSEQLRQSLNHVFYSWLISQNTFPANFNQIAEDFYLLNKFLEKVASQTTQWVKELSEVLGRC